MRTWLPPKIEIRALNFYYGAVKALAGVNMTIADRSITAFIGPSGCGKSTLLRVLNRMYALYPNQRAEGEVLIGGEDILRPPSTCPTCATGSAWCSRSPRHSR